MPFYGIVFRGVACVHQKHASIFGHDSVAASGPTIWTSTYAVESPHCNRLLIEPSCWVQTVHMFTLRLYVSRDLTVTSFVLDAFFCLHFCACIYDLAEFCIDLLSE